MWHRSEESDTERALCCLMALRHPPLDSINSSDLQEVLAGPPAASSEILMSASSPQGEERGGDIREEAGTL